MRKKIARRDESQDGNHRGDDQQVLGQPDSQPGKPGTDECPHKGAAAEGRMKLGHDRAPQAMFDVGAFNILGNIPQSDANAEKEQRHSGARNRLRQK